MTGCASVSSVSNVPASIVLITTITVLPAVSSRT